MDICKTNSFLKTYVVNFIIFYFGKLIKVKINSFLKAYVAKLILVKLNTFKIIFTFSFIFKLYLLFSQLSTNSKLLIQIQDQQK